MVTTRKGKLSDLIPDPENANRGTERGAFQLEQSLQRLGAGRSIVIDRNGVIIAGNKTAEEAGQLGIDDIIIVQTDGKRLVAVQRTDLDLEEDAAARELAFADNRVAQVGLDFDPAAIERALAKGVDLSSYWSPEEIDNLMAMLPRPLAADGRTGEDAPAPEEVEQRAQLGDVWHLGKHRLLVGDPTNEEHVLRLFGSRLAALVWTAPPVDGFLLSDAQRLATQALTVAVRFTSAGAAVYLATPSDATMPRMIAAIKATAFDYRHSLMWVMSASTHRDNLDYQPRHEVLLYGWKTDGAHYFVKDRTKDSVLRVDAPTRLEANPATRPVALVKQMIENSSRRGEIVYDPFLQTGTTLIACERLSRACYAIATPFDADISITRWEAETGKAPEVAR